MNKFQDSPPPESRQHFDIWNFAKAKGDSTYFGQMPPKLVEFFQQVLPLWLSR